MTLTLEYVRSKSAARLSGLLPVVKYAAETLIDRCYARGVPIVITQGLRTIAEQDALYAQGRTKPGAIVTNARGGTSFHNFGVAIDFAVLLPDGRAVSWDTKRDGDLDLLPDWDEVVTEAKRIGFAWGGDWRSFVDMPHFEMTFGLSTAQYRNGICPTKAQIDEVMAAITKLIEGDGDAMTATEKAAFSALEKLVTEQARRLAQLESKASMSVIPTWALAACVAAKKSGALDTTADGSLDFYRMITVMDRAGLFTKEAK